MATLQNGGAGTFLRWLATFPTKLIIPPSCVSLPYQWNPQMCYYYGSERRKLHFRESSFEKFPKGTCPRNPLYVRGCGTNGASPPAEPLHSLLPNATENPVWWSQTGCPPCDMYDVAHVRYIKILTCLWGFLVIFLYFDWFSSYSGLFCELRDNGVVNNLQFWP